MGRQGTGNFSKSGRKWDLEYCCRIGKVLRLRPNLELSWNIFVELMCKKLITHPAEREVKMIEGLCGKEKRSEAWV